MVDPQDIAGELIVAERERKTIGQFSEQDPDFDLDTAYRAQRAFVQDHNLVDLAGQRGIHELSRHVRFGRQHQEGLGEL